MVLDVYVVLYHWVYKFNFKTKSINLCLVKKNLGGRRKERDENYLVCLIKKNISIEIILKFAIFIILFLTYFNSFIYVSPYLFFIYLFIYRQGTLRVKGPTIISPSSNKLQSGERLLRMVTPRLGICHI